MPTLISLIKQCSCVALVCCIALLSTVHAQQQDTARPTQTPDENQDVIRINTDLVQTDVTVFDKSGRFVDNLPREQFELRVDGKPQPISFFERVTAGSVNEEAQLAAARGVARTSKNPATVRPLDRGRTIFFFVDDLHLSFDSLSRTRKTILHFIDNEMGQNDQAVIVSTSGQTGFLGQLTDNKIVLHAAAAKLSFHDRATRDIERPPMSEYQALAIDRRDSDALSYFIDATIRDNPGMRRDTAETMVMNRAHQLLESAAYLTKNTLLTLDSLVRSLSKLPGRKLGFFISDGFFLDTRTSDMTTRLRRITDSAARSGTVLYTMDARGLSTGLPDASSDVPFDTTGRLSRVDLGETSASQEVLRTLASETGGRALLNTNALDKALAKTLKETSAYYLLAWQPEQSEGRANNKFRTIKVTIKDRPDLTVITRRGFFTSPIELPAAKGGKNKSAKPVTTATEKTPDSELRAALTSLYARTELPVALSLVYTDIPGTGTVLSTVVQIDAMKSESPAATAPQTNLTDVVTLVFDDQGKPVASLKDQIMPVSGEANGAARHPILFAHQFRLAQGLYQVRVAARESATGRTGSAIQWIEIPKIVGGKFALGSLFIAERPATETNSATAQSTTPVIISADHRFTRSSHLRFQTSIYNATRTNANAPDVGLQIQVFRDDQPIITAPLSKLSTNGIQDLTRIPYAAEIALVNLPAGQYVLQVTAIDRPAKASTSQRVKFAID